MTRDRLEKVFLCERKKRGTREETFKLQGKEINSLEQATREKKPENCRGQRKRQAACVVRQRDVRGLIKKDMDGRNKVPRENRSTRMVQGRKEAKVQQHKNGLPKLNLNCLYFPVGTHLLR